MAAVAQDTALVAATIARLRSEADASESQTRKAALLHEAGVLEEATGDEAAAARDQLAAVNLEPEFTEPLERLIAIIERRQSYKNLGKLLDRMVNLALTPGEKERAFIDHAFFVHDHEKDTATARALLERAAEEAPDNPTVFLALELFAVRSGDAELRESALLRRAELATTLEWRALLLLDIAAMRAKAGDPDRAFAAVQQAAAIDGPAKFIALRRLEAEARDKGETELEADALEAQAALVMEGLANPSIGDAFGVPRGCRSPAHAADAWRRAAEARRRRGQVEAATELLDRALEQLPGDPALSQARLSLAEAVGDSATMALLSRAEIDAGEKGEVAAGLWLRVAEASAAEGDTAGALDAVRSALSEDNASVPARALELDLLAMGGDGTALATALEAAAERVQNDRAKAAFYLAAADAWVRVAKDTQGARAALSQAGMAGASPSLLARVGRFLAALSGDDAWYEESTRRLITQGAGSEEQVSLWFELARARAKRGDRSGTARAFSAIAAVPDDAWLGNVLTAYAFELLPDASSVEEGDRSVPPPGDTRPWDALLALAENEADEGLARAQRLSAALRALLHGAVPVALELLTKLHEDDPGDALVGVGLAALARAQDNVAGACRALETTARFAEDRALGAALALEAGFLAWRSGAREDALRAFELAAEAEPAAGGPALTWGLRAADPERHVARRRALEAAAALEPELSALERFTLEIRKEGDENAAKAALASLAEAEGALGVASQLGAALFAGAAEETRRSALESLAAHGPAAAAFAHGAAFELELARANGGAPDPHETEAAAARYAESDAGAAAALEWLAATIAKGDIANEVTARRGFGQRLTATESNALEASAALAAWLTGLEEPSPVPGDGAPARLTNLDLAAPGGDPRRRADALLSVEGLIGEESTPLLEALAGYNQLAADDNETALATFRRVTQALPDEVIGWEGLHAAAEALGDRATLAESSAALGDAVADDTRGAELWEQAALILLDELGDRERGHFALSRAVARDIRRGVAFDRLFRSVREQKDGQRLLELIARRLEVAEESDEIVKLFWERARVLRGAGDREGALAALENVCLLEPDHVGALALSGEIYITLKRFEEAAEQLSRLARLPEAPAQQRLMSGVAAVDIYENKLKDVDKALDTLVALHEAKLDTQPVRERLARAAAKAGAFERAAATLEILMNERDSAAGRCEAARLALALRRDRLNDPPRARDAALKLLSELPGDGEALDLLLSGAVSASAARPYLERAREALEESLSNDPSDVEGVERLSRIATALGDARLRQATLGALVAQGVEADDLDRELAGLDRRVARVPSIAIDEGALPDLADPEDGGAIAELMRALGSTIAEAIGPGLAALGATKKDRVDPKAGLPIRNEVVAWAGALGIVELELYVGGRDPDGIFGVATEPPSLVIGRGVTAPLAPIQRQAVARELFALRRGTSVLGHREPADVAALIVAACRLGGVSLESPPFALLAEFERQLGKEMPRRVRKVLPELAARVRSSGEDPLSFYRAATSSLDRMAAVAAGDVSWVLCGDVASRGRVGASVEAQERARRLLSFVLSPSYLALRDKLGMGVR